MMSHLTLISSVMLDIPNDGLTIDVCVCEVKTLFCTLVFCVTCSKANVIICAIHECSYHPYYPLSVTAGVLGVLVHLHVYSTGQTSGNTPMAGAVCHGLYFNTSSGKDQTGQSPLPFPLL